MFALQLVYEHLKTEREHTSTGEVTTILGGPKKAADTDGGIETAEIYKPGSLKFTDTGLYIMTLTGIRRIK